MTSLSLPIGISDFKKLKEANHYFVDKTLIIKDIVTDPSEVVLFTRPRRFGKTLNLSMLRYFLSDNPDDANTELFKGTALAKEQEFCETYQNQYPVIFISFKAIKNNDFNEALLSIRTLMSDLFDNFKEQLLPVLTEHQRTIYQSILAKTADNSVLKKSILYLCQYMHKSSAKQPYVLIDEYDTPITSAYINDYYYEMIDLMRGILGEGLKDNRYLKKGVITGITRVSQESIFSGVNNLEVYSMLREQGGQYFGFTEAEVRQLLADDGHGEQFGEMKSWYNGYQIGRHTLYNPWSIINCVKQHYQYEPYWLNTADNILIKRQLEHGKSSIKETFIDLLQGAEVNRVISDNLVFLELEDNEEAIWSLLHAAGYLNIASTIREGRRKVARFSIPNEEVKYIYDAIIEQWFSRALSLDSYDHLARALREGRVHDFQRVVNSYLMQSGSFFDFNKNTAEQVFHTFMLGLVVGLREHYVISSNQESGFGRYDLTLLPKKKTEQGVLLEFKTAAQAEQLQDRAEEALLQIKAKRYTAVFSQHAIQSVLLLGLAFHGKQMQIASSVEHVQ